MKLESMDVKAWAQFAPYIDTVCLPVKRMTFTEDKGIEGATHDVDHVAVQVEKQLTGRVLLLPTVFDYGRGDEKFFAYIEEVLLTLSQAGFYYLILLLDTPYMDQAQYSSNILVHSVSNNESSIGRIVEESTQKILHLWSECEV